MLCYVETRNQALSKCLNTEQLDSIDYIDLRARRCKEADKWADDGNTYEDDRDRLRSLGWWCEEGSNCCDTCGLHDWSDGKDPDQVVCGWCRQCGACGHEDDCEES